MEYTGWVQQEIERAYAPNNAVRAIANPDHLAVAFPKMSVSPAPDSAVLLVQEREKGDRCFGLADAWQGWGGS